MTWYVLTHPKSGYPVIIYSDPKQAISIAKANGYGVREVKAGKKIFKAEALPRTH